MHIYLDESGDSQGHSPGSSRTFNIAFLKTDENRWLKSIVKSFCRNLINRGWPRDIEIKATTLFGSPKKGNIPSTFEFKNRPIDCIIPFIDEMAQGPISIDYITVKKCNIKEPLRSAQPFTLYNYLAGQLIEYNARLYPNILLIYDQRSKETKIHLRFDQYVETRAFIAATAPGFRFQMYPGDSSVVYGIQAVDFVSWAIHRKYEHGDDRFFSILEPKISERQEWFY